MGNHVMAETMFRHDPRAMLYAPLRTLIWEDQDGNAWFTVDQPSSQFGSPGEQLSQVGRYLDQKLEALLEALHAPIPNLIGRGRLGATGREPDIARYRDRRLQ
jgi:uncharacterized protein (DUF302 family)